MKYSYHWLRELVPDLDAEPAELQHLLTLKTAECEGIEAVAGDWIIEIDNKSLTHRPDLWGHFGIAREVAAITGHKLTDPVKPGLLPAGEPPLSIDIADPLLCPRYSALLVEDIEVAPSPTWLRARLESIGLNSINNIVDLTNYVLAELPQPMHAFDADKLAGSKIIVRNARSGEQLPALNGETYRLAEADLVIADSSGPIALAGVIGGLDTAVSATTTRVVFESANFQAAGVRFTSSRHKLRTDASMRFEKALDPENTVRGLARVVELFRAVCPSARVVGGVADRQTPRVPAPPVALPLSFVTRKLGKPVSQQEVTTILNALGFGVEETAPAVLSVGVPSWRATKDISIKEDLLEEIGRMVGYDSITPAPPLAATVVPPANPLRDFLRRLRSRLSSLGFTEAHNYSFVTESEVKRFGGDLKNHLSVENPVASELTHLRRSLLPGLFKSILTNVHNFREFRLFEIGSEIHPRPAGLPEELPHLAAALFYAEAAEERFFTMKHAVEALFPGSRLTAAAPMPYEHPLRSAEIHWGDALLGRLFELHPALLASEGISGKVVLCDISLFPALEEAGRRVVSYQPVRKYPTSAFDLSILTEVQRPVADLEAALRSLAGPDLANLEFAGIYQGPPLPAGQKSVSYHLRVGALDHTMTAAEVGVIRTRIVEGMRARGFELRGVDSL